MSAIEAYGECAFDAAARKDSILKGLNPSQLNAATTPASVVQILAPPGSGKTRTLAARVAYLLSQGLNPSNVIVATFTVKASREMKERIGRLIGNGLGAKLILGTFHSIARRYLVTYGHLIDVKKGFGIADTTDTAGIIKRIVKRKQLNIDPSAARSRISHLKAQGLGWKDIATALRKESIAGQEFTVIYREYEEALSQANLLDYDDLLLRCVDLLKKHPECVSNVEAVLIDEFQDTNLVQFDVMRLFATWQKRITVVGDPDQSIYGFRAAETKNLKHMRAVYSDTLVVVLEENYRSSAAILNAAQLLIEQDQSRPSKRILPTHEIGTRPVFRKLPDAVTEAQWIVSEVQRIMAMTGNMITPNDVAILVRSSPLTRNVETSFAQAGIPYRMVGGHKFYDRAEVKTVLDYLRIIHHPGNNDALARVINEPPRNIGEVTIKNLLEEAHARNKSLWELVRQGVQGQISFQAKLTKKGEQSLAAFVSVILTAQKMLLTGIDEEKEHYSTEAKLTLVDIMYYFLKKLKYKEYLERKYPEDNDSRWANVEELVIHATDFIAAEEAQVEEDYLPEIEGLQQQKQTAIAHALDRFLANVTLANGMREDAENIGMEQVTISTIHAAKGLEWPVVFVLGVYEGSIPHSRSDDIDEERRLLYVAMTRAQVLLYLSCPKKGSKHEVSGMSQFVDAQIAKILDRKGPIFTATTVQSISHILSRTCPPAVTIELCAATLLSREDNQLPLGDEISDEGNTLNNLGRKGQRVSYEECSAGYGYGKEKTVKPAGWTNIAAITSCPSARSYSTDITTTMSSATFSINTTTAIGFKSARGHLEDLQQRGVQTEKGETRLNERNVRPSYTATVRQKRQMADDTLKGRGSGKEITKKSKVISSRQQRLSGFVTINRVGQKDSMPGKAALMSRLERTEPEAQPMSPHRTKPEYVILSSSPSGQSPPAPAAGSTLSKRSTFTEGNFMKSFVTDFEKGGSFTTFHGAAGKCPSFLTNDRRTYMPDSEGKGKTNSSPAQSLGEDKGTYGEIEGQDFKSYEPVLPPPLLTRTDSKEFPLHPAPTSVFKLPTFSHTASDSKPPLLMCMESQSERDTATTETPLDKAPVIPSTSNGAAVKAIIDCAKCPSRHKTLGIKRSMNGWAERMARNTPGGSSSSAGVRKPAANNRRGMGRGFVRGLLG